MWIKTTLSEFSFTRLSLPFKGSHSDMSIFTDFFDTFLGHVDLIDRLDVDSQYSREQREL
jgi:hypothetical protein